MAIADLAVGAQAALRQMVQDRLERERDEHTMRMAEGTQRYQGKQIDLQQQDVDLRQAAQAHKITQWEKGQALRDAILTSTQRVPTTVVPPGSRLYQEGADVTPEGKPPDRTVWGITPGGKVERRGDVPWGDLVSRDPLPRRPGIGYDAQNNPVEIIYGADNQIASIRPWPKGVFKEPPQLSEQKIARNQQLIDALNPQEALQYKDLYAANVQKLMPWHRWGDEPTPAEINEAITMTLDQMGKVPRTPEGSPGQPSGPPDNSGTYDPETGTVIPNR